MPAGPERKVSLPARVKAVWELLSGRRAPDMAGLGPSAHAPSWPRATTAGKIVSVDTALEIATVWACVRLLSETIATLPLMLYRTDDTGGRTVAADHALYSLLHDEPNADLTAVEFWEGVVLSLCLPGNAYARKERMGRRLVALTPLAADRVAVRRRDDGRREYVHSDRDGRQVYDEDDIFHVRGFGSAGDVGLSPIAYARQSLGAAMAADEHAAALFANGVQPSGVLTIDQVLDADQRREVRENIVAPMAGSGNAGSLFVLEAGMKFQAISMTPEDAQFLQTRSFHVEEICRWFRVPPFMVGHTEKTTSWGTGLEQQMIGFLTFGLRPYLSRIEQAIKRSLIVPEERRRLTPEFKVEGLLRADSKARADFYATMVQNGIMDRNEVRRLENLPPRPGADALTVQSQNVPLGQAPRIEEDAA